MKRVLTWTGVEVQALLTAWRMGPGEFAIHLGYSDTAVENWVKKGRQAKLRAKTQQDLDTDLARAPDDVQERFLQALTSGSLGPSSADRTHALVDQLHTQTEHALTYRPPAGAISHVRDFLQSTSRVLLITGPAGSGKTRLTYHLAKQLAAETDIQLHSASAWDLPHLNLAVEILRYGSVPHEHDALLTLETASAGLSRPCLVVIDGLSAQQQFNMVGRQIDTVLRQVTTGQLRFVLALRTPPAIETSAHPVLNAAIFDPPSARTQGSHVSLGPWDLATARQVWETAPAADDRPFEQLPASVQQLARLPLYMQLLSTSGEGTSDRDDNAYRLIDRCVRAILRAEGNDVGHAIDELADAVESQSPDLIPEILVSAPVARRPERPRSAGPTGQAPSEVLRRAWPGYPHLAHDVMGEYFLATRVAHLLRTRGRSVTTVGALNDLAAQSERSATARNLFELVICCLEGTDPELLRFVALAPTVSISSTLPLMLDIAGDSGGFATTDVLRACTERCDQDSATHLAQALLATASVYPALGADTAAWLLKLLRRFGAAIWPAAMTFIERNVDAAAAQRLLALADLDDGDEAIFFARYYFLFLSNDSQNAGSLEVLLAHPNWRVRVALAEALRDEHSPPTGTSRLVMNTLVCDSDYKVRAAAALGLHRVTTTAARTYLESLLADENWHVRERALHNLLIAHRAPRAFTDLADVAITVTSADSSWKRCPLHVHPTLQRLRLLHDSNQPVADDVATQRALFAILRETRTGWTQASQPRLDALVARALTSKNWVVQREATALAAPSGGDRPNAASIHPQLRREAFRRRRDHRAIQIALDMPDLDDAVLIAQAAADADVDFLEVGDPLIKSHGLHAIERIKKHVPGVIVVAEMMSADWGRDQVVSAAEAGADVVQLIGPATSASVAAAVEAGRRLGVPIVLDGPASLLTQPWIAAMERAGVDGFTITTNIDVGIGSRHALPAARTIRQWTQLPVAVSGGFSAADQEIITSPDWDILIVGRSVTDAVDPRGAARRIAELVRDHTKGHR